MQTSDLNVNDIESDQATAIFHQFQDAIFSREHTSIKTLTKYNSWSLTVATNCNAVTAIASFIWAFSPRSHWHYPKSITCHFLQSMRRNFSAVNKTTVFPTCNSWLNFRVRGQFAIKTWIVRHINTTYFIRIKKNWTCACDHLKTSNLSADNVKNTWPRWVDTWARDTVKRHWSAGTLFWQLSIYQNIDVQYVCIISFPLPGPYAASFQALSVNAFRWRIRYERPGDA